MKLKNHIDHYAQDAELFDYFGMHKNHKVSDQRRFEEIFALLKLQANTNLLEIGSGAGHPAGFCKMAGVTYLPFDLSHKNLKKIKTHSSSSAPVFGDGYHLPFKDGCIDSLIISEVLEHMDEPSKVVAKAYFVLKTKGKICITVP